MTLRQSLVTLVKIQGPEWLRAFLRKSMGTIKNVLPLHAAAWKATSGPIQQLLSTRNVTEQDDLTRLWRENTSSQLNVVCITSALIAGVITSAFTWPIFSAENGPNWTPVFAIWYCSLVLAIWAIACAAQLAISLNRMCTYANGPEKVRQMLGKLEGNALVPRKLQLFIWQTPAMLQNGSIYTFILGLTILIWKNSLQNWSTDSLVILVMFSLTLLFTVTSYVIISIGVYGSM